MIVPMILRRTRRTLKFFKCCYEKHLSMPNLHAIVLDSDNSKKQNIKECNSSKYSKNKEENESNDNNVKHKPKFKVSNSANYSLNTKKELKEKKSITKEESLLSLKEKLHYCSFGVAITNEVVLCKF